MRFLWLLPALAVLGLIAAASPVSAQAPAPGESSGAKESVGPAVRQAKPDVFYLKDKDDKLTPVLGFTLDDFEDLLKLREKQKEPNFTLTGIVGKGEVVGDRAEISLEVNATIRETGWIRVPLRLGSAIPRNPIKHEGKGEFFLDYDAAEQQYVAWLNGPKDATHKLTLALLVPVVETAGGRQIRLSVPRAQSSELTLTVPEANAAGRVSTGAFLESTQAAGKGTQFKAVGLGVDFALDWRLATRPRVSETAVLEASGKIKARLDGRSVHYDAQLTVTSLTGEFDLFRVKLPVGASLVTAETTDYTVQPLAGSEGGADRTNTVEVRWKTKSVGPVTVRLIAEQRASSGEEWSFGGFEVVDAVRQYGQLAAEVQGDWQILWGERSQIRQTENLTFEYSGQPFKLAARIVPRQTRISLEPTYVIRASDKQLELEARLKYRVRGGKAFSLRVELADWQLDEVGPNNLVSSAELAAGNTGPLVIPLVQPSGDEFELVLKAHRALPAKLDKLTVALPKPTADNVASAALMLLPAENLDVAVIDADTAGMVRQPSPLDTSTAASQRAPLYFRAEGADSHLGLRFAVLPGKVSAELTTRVALTDTGGNVDQTYHYLIANEPVESLDLEIPNELAQEHKLEVQIDGRMATPVVQDAADDATTTRLRLPLGTTRTGPVEVGLQYAFQNGQRPPRAGVLVAVPLALPLAGQLAAHDAYVTPTPSMRVQPQKGWAAVGSAARAGEMHLVSQEPQRELKLAIQDVLDLAGKNVAIDRLWVQTWLRGGRRLDRMVCQLENVPDRLELKLPPGVDLAEVQTWIDGVAAHPATAGEKLLLDVPTTGGRTTGSHQIELRYQSTRTDGGSLLTLVAPEFAKQMPAGRMYWQIVLPADEYLLGDPAGYVSEAEWQWRGWRWTHGARVGQSFLEDWSGARPYPPIPERANTYLFSTVGPATPLVVRNCTRASLVFFGAGLVLAAGLLLLYVPRVRHPAVLLAVGVAVVAVALNYPDQAMLLAQAALLGLLLLAVAVLLRKKPPVRRSAARRLTSSSIWDRGSTRTQALPPVAHSPSTETSPLAIPVSSSSIHS